MSEWADARVSRGQKWAWILITKVCDVAYGLLLGRQHMLHLIVYLVLAMQAACEQQSWYGQELCPCTCNSVVFTASILAGSPGHDAAHIAFHRLRSFSFSQVSRFLRVQFGCH